MPPITFANPLPWWALSLIVAAIGALAWHAYRRFSAWPRRRLVLSALRFATLLLLVLVLMRPVTRSHEAGDRETVVPILVDTSRSMAIQDAGGARRIERAQALLNDALLPALSAGFRVEVLAFGEQISEAAPGDLHATGRRSDLARALDDVRERYRAQPVAGLVLVSDGGDTSGLVDDVVAAGRLPAVYPIGVGSADAGVDREVLSVTAADAVPRRLPRGPRHVGRGARVARRRRSRSGCSRTAGRARCGICVRRRTAPRSARRFRSRPPLAPRRSTRWRFHRWPANWCRRTTAGACSCSRLLGRGACCSWKAHRDSSTAF